MALSWWGCQTGTTFLMPCVPNCCGGAENGERSGKLWLERALVDSRLRVAGVFMLTEGCHQSTGSTEFPKAFRGVRLKEVDVSREFSGIPPSTSSRAVEKAMKDFRAEEECWSAEPKCKQLLCTALSKNVEIDTLEGASRSLQIVGARVNELWCKDASVSYRHEQQVLDVGLQSSHPLAYRREVLMDGVTSNSEADDSIAENFSSIRIAGGNWCSSDDVTRSHDDNHYQDSPVFSSVFSKDGFWATAEMKSLAKRQATQKFVTLHQQRPDRPDMQNHVDDRYINRCIHHLLAVLSFPRKTTVDKEPVYSEQEQTVFSKRGIDIDLEANEDDDHSSVMSRASGSDDSYYQKRSMHLWDGYWAGPDYEDGWGFVEALVSPADMGESVCWTTE